mmetsp:Transcript_20778/g.70422  ORF Transcript_20778/g.70422 Transcript_20778/m.70422 type:complete len:250 (-) Transcript_20778:351-1100(-)
MRRPTPAPVAADSERTTTLGPSFLERRSSAAFVTSATYSSRMSASTASILFNTTTRGFFASDPSPYCSSSVQIVKKSWTGSSPVQSTMCTRMRHRATCRRNASPMPAPCDASSMRPGTSAKTRPRSSAALAAATGASRGMRTARSATPARAASRRALPYSPMATPRTFLRWNKASSVSSSQKSISGSSASRRARLSLRRSSFFVPRCLERRSPSFSILARTSFVEPPMALRRARVASLPPSPSSLRTAS